MTTRLAAIPARNDVRCHLTRPGVIFRRILRLSAHGTGGSPQTGLDVILAEHQLHGLRRRFDEVVVRSVQRQSG